MTEQLPVEYQAAAILADALQVAITTAQLLEEGPLAIDGVTLSANLVRFTVNGMEFHAVVMGA